LKKAKESAMMDFLHAPLKQPFSNVLSNRLKKYMAVREQRRKETEKEKQGKDQIAV